MVRLPSVPTDASKYVSTTSFFDSRPVKPMVQYPPELQESTLSPLWAVKSLVSPSSGWMVMPSSEK